MSYDCIIRRAKLFDIAKINTIEKEAFPTPWSFDALFTDIFLNDNTAYFVAVTHGSIAGYGGMWIVLDEAHITNIAVKKEYRGRGLASAMMKKIISHAKSKQVAEVSLEVRRSNLVAQKLYSNFDFFVNGERPNYYSNPKEDALIMRKLLL